MVDGLGFKWSNVDQAVFYQREHGLLIIMLLVHMDNCTIVANKLLVIQRFKINIAKHLEITDLDELHWILGIEVHCICESCLLLLSQCLYIDLILQCYGFKDTKPVSLPIDPSTRLSSAQSPSTMEEFTCMRNVPYLEAVGSLMYASLGTWSDITYAVQAVSRFSTKLDVAHWEAVKRVFHYLKGTRDL